MPATKLRAVQVSPQPSLIEALAKLVQAPGDQARQPGPAAAARARAAVPEKAQEQGIPSFAHLTDADFDRKAPRGSYLNIVV